MRVGHFDRWASVGNERLRLERFGRQTNSHVVGL